MTARVLVAGANGRTGRHVLRYLDETEYEAVAATRDDAAADALRDYGADAVRVGDLLVDGDPERLVADCTHVVAAVGAGPSLDALLGRPLVDGAGVAALARAAAAEGVQRVSLVSSVGVGDSSSGMALPLRVLLWPVLRAKARGEAALRDADVTHAIVRPGALTDAPATNDVVVGEGGESVSGSIPRADVARLLVAALDTPGAWNRTLEAVARDGLRGDPEGVVSIGWVWPD